MKRFLFVFLIIPHLFISCVDPISREYKVYVSLNNISISAYSCYASVQNAEGAYLVSVRLDNNNNFSDVYKPCGMGSQRDFTNPSGKLKDMLNQITSGNTFIISEKGDGDKIIRKYKISYEKDDVEDITKVGDLYRSYKIQLDWNKKEPINTDN